MKKTRMVLIGKRIKLARELAGLTQEKLAEIIGVSRTAVVRWESGETVPTVDHLIEMTSVLQVSADFLLGISDTDQVTSTLMEMASTLNRLISYIQDNKGEDEK